MPNFFSSIRQYADERREDSWLISVTDSKGVQRVGILFTGQHAKQLAHDYFSSQEYIKPFREEMGSGALTEMIQAEEGSRNDE